MDQLISNSTLSTLDAACKALCPNGGFLNSTSSTAIISVVSVVVGVGSALAHFFLGKRFAAIKKALCPACIEASQNSQASQNQSSPESSGEESNQTQEGHIH